MWDLATQSLITTFHFPKPIYCIVWDITERLFFASSPDGSIYQVNLFRERQVQNNPGPFIEAVGGAGASDIVRFDADDTAGRKRLIDVGQPVTALCTSLNGSLLLVGTASGLIHVYDIASHQLLRTISTHKGMSISFLATMLKPPDLVGHISLSLNVASVGDARDVMPVRPVAAFHRMKDMSAREVHEVSMMLPMTNKVSYLISSCVPLLFIFDRHYKLAGVNMTIPNFNGIYFLSSSRLKRNLREPHCQVELQNSRRKWSN